MAADESEKTRGYRGKTQPHQGRDRRLAELAEGQHGVVAVWQLIPLGFTDDAILRRATAGHLHRIHHGVYAVGYRKLTPRGHRMAAVLAFGAAAVISFQTSAANWEIGQPSSRIHVTTPTSRRSRPAIQAHQAILHPEDVATHAGIPTTSVARTIYDLAAQRDETGLAHLIEEADHKAILDLHALEHAIARRPRAAGVGRLNAILADYRGPADTRSKLERAFRRFIANGNLPEPQYNVVVAGLTVDVFWPQWRLVVELDSRKHHATLRAFERDRVRDAILQKAGFRVLRITTKRLENEPTSVLADIIAFSRN